MKHNFDLSENEKYEILNLVLDFIFHYNLNDCDTYHNPEGTFNIIKDGVDLIDEICNVINFKE